MKAIKILMTLIVLTTSGLCLAQDFPPIHCLNKPASEAFILKVSHIDHNYCTSYENTSFECKVGNEYAEVNDIVLAYTEYECVDIGHIPGMRFMWLEKVIAVKILN
jgi:hypothetical protein